MNNSCFCSFHLIYPQNLLRFMNFNEKWQKKWYDEVITEWLTSAFPCDRNLFTFKYWLRIMWYGIIKQRLMYIHIKHDSIRWRCMSTKILRVKMSSKTQINIERWMWIENKHTCRVEVNLLHPSTNLNYSVLLILELRNFHKWRAARIISNLIFEYFIRAKVVSHHLNCV